MRSSVISQLLSLARLGTIPVSIDAPGKLLTRNENPDSIAAMKTKTIGLTLAFCFFGWAVCFAANPQMGTWKLNEAKSKITPGTTKNTHVVYSGMLGQMKVTSDGVDANGKPVHIEWSGK